MKMSAEILCFEVEAYDFKRGHTKIPVLRLVDATPDYRLREIVDLELTDEQASRLPAGDLSKHVCEVGIREIWRGLRERVRARGEIISLDGKSF